MTIKKMKNNFPLLLYPANNNKKIRKKAKLIIKNTKEIEILSFLLLSIRLRGTRFRHSVIKKLI